MQVYVSPNPMVGAVLVRDDQIIGEGYHQKYGQAHAEVNAIESADNKVQGATLYCTLEPCSHLDKNTPPCAQHIAKVGIKRVVIASKDPNPQVNGKGIAILRESGIDVTTGVLDEQNRELNRFFFKYMATKLPYVMVKIAQTLDGKITLSNNEQTWISNEKSRSLVHSWRAVYDAVLVGANTIRVDNPGLTVREVTGRNPKRIILSDSLLINKGAKVFTDDHAHDTILLTTVKDTSELFISWSRSDISVHHISGSFHDAKSILETIAGLGVTSLMVEGGAEIFSQFISSGFVDEIQIFIAPKIFGTGVAALDHVSGKRLDEYSLFKTNRIGSDVLLTYRKK